jgi:hypothetical protein
MNSTQDPPSGSPTIQTLGTPNSAALIVLDGGVTCNRSTWSRIVSAFENAATFLLIERSHYPAEREIDVVVESAAISCAIDQLAQRSGNVSTLILAGTGVGNLVMQDVASRSVALIAGLVLIDPPPRAVDHSGVVQPPDSRIRTTATPSETPITVILPGTSAATDFEEKLGNRNYQSHDLECYPNRREIIAGRSRENIVLERPDVVIDAIQQLLNVQSFRKQESGT